MIHQLTVQFLAKGSYAVEVIHPSYCAAAKSNSFVGLCFQPCMNSQLAGTSKNLECQRFSILITLNCADFWAFKCPCRTVGFQMAHTFEASPQRPLIFIYFFTSTVVIPSTCFKGYWAEPFCRVKQPGRKIMITLLGSCLFCLILGNDTDSWQGSTGWVVTCAASSAQSNKLWGCRAWHPGDCCTRWVPIASIWGCAELIAKLPNQPSPGWSHFAIMVSCLQN